jgi:hypothetical protein
LFLLIKNSAHPRPNHQDKCRFDQNSSATCSPHSPLSCRRGLRGSCGLHGDLISPRRWLYYVTYCDTNRPILDPRINLTTSSPDNCHCWASIPRTMDRFLLQVFSDSFPLNGEMGAIRPCLRSVASCWFLVSMGHLLKWVGC